MKGLCPDCLEVLQPQGNGDQAICPECRSVFGINDEGEPKRQHDPTLAIPKPGFSPPNPLADIDPPDEGWNIAPPIASAPAPTQYVPLGGVENTPAEVDAKPTKIALTYQSILTDVPVEQIDNDIVRDIVQRYRFIGRLSHKQAKLIENYAKRQSAPPLSAGPRTVTGTVAKIKDDMADANKQTHLHVDLDDGNRLYVKLRQWNYTWNVGDRIEVEATITPSNDDPHFGFTRLAKVKRVEVTL